MRKLLCALLLLATPAQADRISTMLASHHIGAAGFNELNPGLFYTFERKLDLTFGAFYNSYDKISVSATVARTLFETKGLKLQVFGGLVQYPDAKTHFRVQFENLVPVVGLQAISGNTYLQLLPGDGKPVAGIIAAGLTWKVN